MDLRKTVDYMNSKDYKQRFIAEYFQLKTRYDGLHKMLVKYDAGTLDFKPSCSYDLLAKQAKAMGEYLYYLEVRAEIEKIYLFIPDITCNGPICGEPSNRLLSNGESILVGSEGKVKSYGNQHGTL